jgi:hypothetical protein
VAAEGNDVNPAGGDFESAAGKKASRETQEGRTHAAGSESRSVRTALPDGPGGPAGSERYATAVAIEAEIEGLLELGAAGRLLITGDVEEVLRLDDADLTVFPSGAAFPLTILYLGDILQSP